MRHCFLVKNMVHICRLKAEREFLIIGSSSFHMYASGNEAAEETT